MKENQNYTAALNLSASGNQYTVTGCLLLMLTGVFSMTQYETITITVAFLALIVSILGVYMNKKALRGARAVIEVNDLRVKKQYENFVVPAHELINGNESTAEIMQKMYIRMQGIEPPYALTKTVYCWREAKTTAEKKRWGALFERETRRLYNNYHKSKYGDYVYSEFRNDEKNFMPFHKVALVGRIVTGAGLGIYYLILMMNAVNMEALEFLAGISIGFAFCLGLGLLTMFIGRSLLKRLYAAYYTIDWDKL